MKIRIYVQNNNNIYKAKSSCFNMKKEKVLITGGAGYIGSVLTEELLKEGYEVTCLDNLSLKQNSLINYAYHSDFEFIYGDCRDEKLLEKIIPKFDVIIPLAAVVGMPACNARPFDAKTINYDAIVLLNKIRKPNQKLIYPNTNSGYGIGTGDIHCTEETPLSPISLYGITKCDSEKHLLENEKDAITLRLATVFGSSPRMRTDLLVNNFTLCAKRDGVIILYEKDFKRNFVHIRDVAKCFIYCIKNYESMKNKAYNLGLDEANISKIELAQKIKKYIPKFEIIEKEIEEDPDKRNYIVSNKRLENAGFKAKISLDEGIKELIKTYNILLHNDPYKNI